MSKSVRPRAPAFATKRKRGRPRKERRKPDPAFERWLSDFPRWFEQVQREAKRKRA